MPDIWGAASVLVKLVQYTSLILAVGLVLVQTLFSDLTAPLRGRMRRQIVGLAIIGGVATSVGFLLRGAMLTGGVDGMVDPEMLGLLWSTSVRDATLYRGVGAGLILTGLFVPRVGALVSYVGGGLVVWSFAIVGHIPETEQTVVQVLLCVHLVGVAFWMGVLGPLHGLSRQVLHLERAAQLGERFGQAASAAVPLLILAGIGMAWFVLGDLAALFGTEYGLALLGKIALVALVLTLAAANKLRFVPAMLAGQEQAAKHLVRSIRLEAALIFIVLAITATLTSVLELPH